MNEKADCKTTYIQSYQIENQRHRKPNKKFFKKLLHMFLQSNKALSDVHKLQLYDKVQKRSYVIYKIESLLRSSRLYHTKNYVITPAWNFCNGFKLWVNNCALPKIIKRLLYNYL